jgi:hypothetical protein
MKRETWRITAILVAILAAAFYLYPTYQFYYDPPTNPDEAELVRQKAINLGLDLQGGIHLVLEVDPSKLSEDERSDVVERVREVIANRVDQFGVAEPIIHREGEWRIVVELPGVRDVERAKALIDRTAALEFKILKPVTERDVVLDRIEGHLQRTNLDTTTAGDDLFTEESVKETPSLRRYLRVLSDDIWVPADNLLTVRQILADPAVQDKIPGDSQFLWGSKTEQLGDGESYRALFFVKARSEMSGEIVAVRISRTPTSPSSTSTPPTKARSSSRGLRVLTSTSGWPSFWMTRSTAPPLSRSRFGTGAPSSPEAQR